MSKVRVVKDELDWIADCAQHRDKTWCGTWADAFEAALGHVCMHHPVPLCVHEYGVLDVLTNEHTCVGCGADLEPILWHGWPQEPTC